MQRTLLYAAGLMMIVAGTVLGCHQGGCPSGNCGNRAGYAPHGGSWVPGGQTGPSDFGHAGPAPTPAGHGFNGSGSDHGNSAPGGSGGGFGSGAR